MPDFFDPPDLQNIVLVSVETLRQGREAHRGLRGLRALDRVTGNDPSVTDYVMVEALAKCL